MFLVAVKVRKYKDVMLGKEVVPAQNKVLDMMADKGKKEMKARDVNKSAFADLTLSCQDDISFGIVMKSVTEKLPERGRQPSVGKPERKVLLARFKCDVSLIEDPVQQM